MLMNTLDLFSGIGGFSLGLKKVCKTVAYCEIDPLCVQILKNNIDRGTLPDAPIFNDVKILTASHLHKLQPIMLTTDTNTTVIYTKLLEFIYIYSNIYSNSHKILVI